MADHAALLAEIERAIAAAPARGDALAAVCRLLAERLPGYDWVGFYLVDPARPRELVLGPFVGEPTEHTRIPFGRGICGQVAEREETMVVEDVTAEANYLACSVSVRSEIVVPILAGGRFVGQLDIDSHVPARFGPADRALCEAICARLAPHFAAGAAPGR
jgi:GAF domain-containing protein